VLRALTIGRDERDRKVLLVVMAGVVAVAWLAIWTWGQSPYGRYLDHEALEEVELGSAAALLLFVGGWTLMTVAMMLPTASPLVSMFTTVVQRRDDRVALLALLAGGYLTVWAMFGLAAYGGDLVLHRLTGDDGWLERNAWALGAGTLGLAGAYQFTKLKYQCLDKCRTPRMFIMQRWRGSHERRNSFMLGVDHGTFCVGCCWSLMLLMFAVGHGSLVWMLGLGTMMAVEKNAPWGRRISAPLGYLLLVAAAVVTAANV